MSFTKELFIAAVAVCALIAAMSPAHPQDAGAQPLIQTHR